MLLVLGCFLEGSTIILVILPVLLPTAQALGIDPVHFGVVAVLNIMIGLVTPPYGLLLFMMTKIADVSPGRAGARGDAVPCRDDRSAGADHAAARRRAVAAAPGRLHRLIGRVQRCPRRPPSWWLALLSNAAAVPLCGSRTRTVVRPWPTVPSGQGGGVQHSAGSEAARQKSSPNLRGGSTAGTLWASLRSGACLRAGVTKSTWDRQGFAVFRGRRGTARDRQVAEGAGFEPAGGC